MLDSSACSRVSLLVVALGLVCTCCNSFLVPGGPHSRRMTQGSVGGVRRLTTAGAGRATRMMAGDLDVSLACFFYRLQKNECGTCYPPRICWRPHPPSVVQFDCVVQGACRVTGTRTSIW